jgi:hypothetical protein
MTVIGGGDEGYGDEGMTAVEWFPEAHSAEPSIASIVCEALVAVEDGNVVQDEKTFLWHPLVKDEE